MLNLSEAVTFSQEEENHIQGIYATGLSGPYMWKKNDEKTRAIKHKISVFTMQNQGVRCVYCESVLRNGIAPIEHLAPKEKHREFTFHPQNLFAACGCCNSPIIKGRKDTISSNPKFLEYENNEFSIVHPLFDNPDDHIKYLDADRIMFDLNACSQKGVDTIDFFNWKSYSAYVDRVHTAATRHLSIDVNQLIQEISTYKPKSL